MIPDRAVKEALDRIPYQAEFYTSEEDMRYALEAAAPYMLAPLVAELDNWAGRSKPGYYDEAQDDVVQILNPYRSQT